MPDVSMTASIATTPVVIGSENYSQRSAGGGGGIVGAGPGRIVVDALSSGGRVVNPGAPVVVEPVSDAHAASSSMRIREGIRLTVVPALFRGAASSPSLLGRGPKQSERDRLGQYASAEFIEILAFVWSVRPAHRIGDAGQQDCGRRKAFGEVGNERD